MKKQRTEVKHHIISARITWIETMVIDRLARSRNVKRTNLLREALFSGSTLRQRTDGADRPLAMMQASANYPRYNVLSVRVSDQELQALEVKSYFSNKSISDLVRDALNSFIPAISEESRRMDHRGGRDQEKCCA